MANRFPGRSKCLSPSWIDREWSRVSAMASKDTGFFQCFPLCPQPFSHHLLTPCSIYPGSSAHFLGTNFCDSLWSQERAHQHNAKEDKDTPKVTAVLPTSDCRRFLSEGNSNLNLLPWRTAPPSGTDWSPGPGNLLTSENSVLPMWQPFSFLPRYRRGFHP